MLAIKSLLANRTEMPCLIFDEIDTGISGETALKVAGILKELSSQHQVVSITHLPQIAAKADHHLFVSKDDTSGRQQTKVKNLSTVEREEAIAKMLSGKSKSKSALLAAKDLLNNN
jgi:DNA repair protein RecN (Recombination protein N)